MTTGGHGSRGPAGRPRPAAGVRRRPVRRAGRWQRRTAAWHRASQALVARARAAHRAAERRFPVVTHLADRLVSVNVFDSATRLAAQCFLTAVPLLFVFAAYAPPAVRRQVVDSAKAVIGLRGPAEAQLQHVLQPATHDLQQATGVIGGLMVLLSATAVSRALQRLCRRAWQIPRGTTRVAPWRWVAWLALWLAAMVLQGLLRDGLGLGAWLGVPLLVLMQAGLWWWTQHLLLGGTVGWKPLLPGSVLTALALTALTATAALYMPRALDRALSDYGPVGSVFVLLSWLIVVCVAVAVTLSTGAVAAQEPALARRLGSPPRRGGGT
ncbi:YihY/virulence factor BrkB family protein [Streptomyces sp. J2-1]|nr:YihY/virulence factor BrkB family protein [Streptomyces corallincola]